MVGGLVHNEEIGFQRQHFAQCHALDFATRELAHLPVGVLEAEVAQELPELLPECRQVVGVHSGSGGGTVFEYLLEYACVRTEVVFLLQERYAYVLEEEDSAAGIGLVLAGEYAQKGGLARAVRCNQGNLVSFVDIETYVLEKYLRAVGLGYVFNLKITGHKLTEGPELCPWTGGSRRRRQPYGRAGTVLWRCRKIPWTGKAC